MKKENTLLPRIPVSTYRVQFNKHFTFTDARAIVDYLCEIGMSEVYSSPYFKAKEGSLHGYDIVDPTTFNPEIGTEEEFNDFIAEVKKYGMGHILDIVPNHMCIESQGNAWWMDVLENGPSSLYADYFDINWNPVKRELRERILIPILGDQFGRILENQELRLAFEHGAFYLYYYENKFPVIPETYMYILKQRIDCLENRLTPENPDYVELMSIMTAIDYLPRYTETESKKIAERYREKEIIKKRLWTLYQRNPEIQSFINENIVLFNGKKGESESFNLLDELLKMQTYRLSNWRVATEEINYRRFFDINSLAAIRIENPAVFKHTHTLIIRLISEGKVTGLRVDHPDGLYNPFEYFHELQEQCYLQTRLAYSEQLKDEISLPYRKRDIKQKIIKQYKKLLASDPQYKPFYIIGEKILIKDERLPEDWPIFSTTGYVFLNVLNGIFIRTENAKIFSDIYERFTKLKIHFQDLVYEKKKLIMQVAMASDINTLGHYLNILSEKDRHTRDFTLNSLTLAIIEIVAFFPVYRTYTHSSEINERDQKYIEFAVSKAKKKNPAISGSIFDFLHDILVLNYPEKFNDNDKRKWLDFVMRFQQITGPVMAKGLEDTVFYVYNRLLSLNEVGGSPDRFGTSLETFHGKNIERMKFWSHALITTSTHDTKRGEDVRARMNVLSEYPEEWRRCLMTWIRLNKKKKLMVEGQMVPDRNEEYLLYQTLIGAWPVGKMGKEEYDTFKTRIKQYMLKASREAKVNTSWINPNTIYEEALIIFIDSILDNNANNQFINDFRVFQEKISHYGMFNSLSQTLLKITSPGIPDFYQGTEIWNYTLVDPDNRQPVEYSFRRKMFDELKEHESKTPRHELAKDLTVHKANGMIKLYLIYKALNYRRGKRDLFENGEYLPLEVMGKKAEHICAFARRMGNERVIVIAPRFYTKLIPQPTELPFGKAIWEDASVIIPIAEPGAKYCNIFTDENIIANDYKQATSIHLSQVFSSFPVAMLERIY